MERDDASISNHVIQHSDHFPLILVWLPTLRIQSRALEVSNNQDRNRLDAVAICIFDLPNRVDDPRHDLGVLGAGRFVSEGC